MTIQQFIEKAIEGGWDWNDTRRLFQKSPEEGTEPILILLDPLAWQAVGKVEGWEGVTYIDGKLMNVELLPHSWYANMHRMIDALSEGKTIEEFLATL